MKRRAFFSRIAKAAIAFSVAPGVFKALPAAAKVRAVVSPPKVVVTSFWLQTTRRTRCVDAAYREFQIRAWGVSNGRVSVSPEPVDLWKSEYADFKARLDAAKNNSHNFLAAEGREG